MLFSHLPHTKLADWPTPLQHLPRFGSLVGHDQLYIKRDDLTSIGMGGDKVRNLEFLLGEALQAGVDLRHIALVGAMAGTATGFLYGTALLGHPFHVHLISVEYPRDRLRQIIAGIWDGVAKLTGIRPSLNLDQVVTIYDDYLGAGYAAPTPEATRTVYVLARSEAIFIENVYTSKTLHGMVDLIQKGIIPHCLPKVSYSLDMGTAGCVKRENPSRALVEHH